MPTAHRTSKSAKPAKKSKRPGGARTKTARPGKRASQTSSRQDDLRRRAEKVLQKQKGGFHALTDDREGLIQELRIYQAELEIQNQELREAQVDLAATRDRYVDLYEFAPVGYLTLDPDGIIRESNLMAPVLLGTHRSALVGLPIVRFLVAEARRDWHRHQADTLASERKRIAEFPVRGKDRRARILRFESVAFDDRSGMRCALVDETDRRQAEEKLELVNRGLELRVAARTAQLEESNAILRERILENERITHDLQQQTARLRTILETAADGILTIDARGKIETVNPAAERMFGYKGAELTGRKVNILMPLLHTTKQPGGRASKVGSSRLIGTWLEQVGRRKDGTTFPIDLTASEFYDGESKFTEVVRDITERRHLQWQIVQSVTEEQQSIGRSLHDGVAQHVTATEMMVGLLEKNLRKARSADASLAADALHAVREAQTQLRATMRGVLPYTVHALGLEAALSELAKTTTKLQGIECELRSKGPMNLGDANRATQLYYIASEAIHNAVRHARPSRIVVSLRGKSSATELSVRDDGVGIEPKDAKDGAGLQIMRYRASLIGAALDVSNPAGGGTLVKCVSPNVWQ